MKHWQNPILTTAIQVCQPVSPTAIMVDPATPRWRPVPRADGDVANIILLEAGTARRAARWLRGANHLNLGLCLALFFMAIEIGDHTTALGRYALGLWFLLDFMPVALVFAGGQRLKRLKCLPLAWTGAACMLYLALERLVAASLLAALHPSLPHTIPTPDIVLACGLAMFVINTLAAQAVLRLLSRPEFRAAFR